MIFGISFGQPWLLLLLLVIPVAAALLVRRWRSGEGTFRYPNSRTLERVRAGRIAVLSRLPDVLRLLALAALIVAFARPQAEDNEILTGEGVDVMIAVDMSGSMNAVDMSAEEISEKLADNETPKNRFHVARDILRGFVDNRSGQDRVGLVVFGEHAYLKFPLTLDYLRVQSILAGLVLDNGQRSGAKDRCTNGCTISGSGTAIGDAIGRSYRRLQQSKAKSKVIVLITDGTNEGGKLQPETIVDYIASRPADEQVRIYTFLVGNDDKTHVPVQDYFGNVSYEPPPRPFPTNPELLRQIAEQTGGQFFESYDEAKFREDFDTLEKTAFETTVHTNHKDIFPPFVLFASLVVGLELVLRLTVFRKFP
jgi:Ca-activated chloride channel family protein